MKKKNFAVVVVLSIISGTLFLLCILTSPSLASQIFVGCTEGMIESDDQSFPQQSIGNVPDRIANWELVFQKGNYKIRVSSRFEFVPFIYKKINGKYRYAGLPNTVRMQNDKHGNAFFYYDFFANHANEAYSNRNWWLVQIKPVPSAQNISHRIRLTTKPVSCPGNKQKSSAPCPVGHCGNPGTFGTVSGCRKSSPSCGGWMCGTPGCP